MPMTADKAIAAFLTSLVALIGIVGFKTDWATPDLISTISVVGGALVTAIVTYLIPNKPKV